MSWVNVWFLLLIVYLYNCDCCFKLNHLIVLNFFLSLSIVHLNCIFDSNVFIVFIVRTNIVIYFRCSLWLYYGVLLTNRTLISVNVFGSLLFAVYTLIYYKYTLKKVSCSKIIIWCFVQQKPVFQANLFYFNLLKILVRISYSCSFSSQLFGSCLCVAFILLHQFLLGNVDDDLNGHQPYKHNNSNFNSVNTPPKNQPVGIIL